MSVYRDGQGWVMLETGMPDTNAYVGVGDTLAEAMKSLQMTPIQCTGPDCGESDALEWAEGQGWIDSVSDLEKVDPEEVRTDLLEMEMKRGDQWGWNYDITNGDGGATRESASYAGEAYEKSKDDWTECWGTEVRNKTFWVELRVTREHCDHCAHEIDKRESCDCGADSDSDVFHLRIDPIVPPCHEGPDHAWTNNPKRGGRTEDTCRTCGLTRVTDDNGNDNRGCRAIVVSYDERSAKIMKYISNAFSVGMLCMGEGESYTLEVTHMNLRSALDWFNNWSDAPPESCVGHADTALLISEILGQKVEVRRVSTSLKIGDELLVAQYNGPRLPEGTTSLPEGAKIRWMLVRCQSGEGI